MFNSRWLIMRMWQCIPLVTSAPILALKRGCQNNSFFFFFLPHSSGFKFNHSGINRSQPAWPLVCLTNRRAVGLGPELHVWNPRKITSAKKGNECPRTTSAANSSFYCLSSHCLYSKLLRMPKALARVQLDLFTNRIRRWHVWGFALIEV